VKILNRLGRTSASPGAPAACPFYSLAIPEKYITQELCGLM